MADEGRGVDIGGGADAPFSVEFELTPEEWVDVAVRHNLESDLFKGAVRNGQRAFGALVVLLALLGFLGGYASFAMVWLFAGAVAVALLPKSFQRSQRKQYATIARGGITNGMFGTHRVSLLESGLLDETDAYQRLTRWHAVERVEDGPGSFMIYYGSDAFLPIPHSAFRDAESLRTFGDRFFEHVGSGPARQLGSRDPDDPASG